MSTFDASTKSIFKTKSKNKEKTIDDRYKLSLHAIQQQIALELGLIKQYSTQQDQLLEQMFKRYSNNEIPALDYDSASERIELIHSILDQWFLEDLSLKEAFKKISSEKISKGKPSKLGKHLTSVSHISNENQKTNIIQEKELVAKTSFSEQRKNPAFNQVPTSNTIPDKTDLETWNLAEEVMQFELEIKKNFTNIPETKEKYLPETEKTVITNMSTPKEQPSELTLEKSLRHVINGIGPNNNSSKTTSNTIVETESMMKELEDLKKQVGIQSYRLNTSLRFILYQILNEIVLIKDKDRNYINHIISGIERNNELIKDAKIAESLELALNKLQV